MSNAKNAAIARLRQEFEGSDFDSTRTLTRLRGAIAQITEDRSLTEDERDDVRALAMGYMSRFHQDMLSDWDRMLMRHGGRVSFKARAAPSDDQRTRDEAVQPKRERNFSRVVKGAQELGKPVDELTNRQRRLLAAVTNLPEPWEKNRERGEGEAFSRHLTALRTRLDWLVKLEDEHGDQQRGMHNNRAERNALVFALESFAEEAGAEAARGPALPPDKKYAPEYIDRLEEQFEDAVAGGFTVTRLRQPGLLHHRSGDTIAPLQVPIGVWCLVRGYVRGQEDV